MKVIFGKRELEKVTKPVTDLPIGQLFTGKIWAKGEDETIESEEQELESDGPFVRVLAETWEGENTRQEWDATIPILDLENDTVVMVPKSGYVEDYKKLSTAEIHVVE